MKYYLFFYIAFSTFLFSASVIVNIDSRFNISSDFDEIIKNNLEDYKYNVKDMTETDSLDIETKKTKIKCRKKSCYIELGDKFKVDYLLNVSLHKITDLYTSKYRVKLEFINLKSLERVKKIFYYKYKLSSTDKLRAFTEGMMIKFFAALDDIKKKKEIERLNRIPEKLTKKDVLTMIRKVYPEIKKCGKKNNYSGIVKVHFKINNDGSISDIKFITNVTDIIKDCLYSSLTRMRTIKFRGMPLNINFPLKLD